MTQVQSIDNGVSKQIELVVPISTEMVRIVRLTVSGIASTIGFELDTIEDIKVAVAEICNRIIIKMDSISRQERYVIKFDTTSNALIVKFLFENEKPQGFDLFDKDDIFGVAIVNALVDDVLVNHSQQSNEIVSLYVFLKENEV